jgi:hypothetical protein
MALKRTGFKRTVHERQPLAAPRPIRQVAATRISSEAQALPKSPRYADRHLLDMARGQPCLLRSPICNHDVETSVACHGAGVAAGKGMAYKVSDPLSVIGCSSCNHFTDAYGNATAAEKRAVFEAGHARQVARWREIAASTTAAPRDIASARAALVYLIGLGMVSARPTATG